MSNETAVISMESTNVMELQDPTEHKNGLLYTTLMLLPRLGWAILQLLYIGVVAIFRAIEPSLSRRLSFSFSVSALLMLSLALVAVLWAMVRYHWLTRYSRLHEDDQAEDEISEQLLDDLHYKDSDDEKDGTSGYFDEFLSAIQIFGYLDRKVFMELTKSMQTYRLNEGETLHHHDVHGFAFVVDGVVQVYSKPLENSSENNGYELINEVKRAAPLSSLFSILSLFTEDVELNDNLNPSHVDGFDYINSFRSVSRAQSPTSSSPKATDYFDHDHPQEERIHEEPPESQNRMSDFEKVSQEVLSVAKTPATIAVIPARAFRMLTRKYPRATANIVQIILTRWSRVTFRACHHYLNLTSHIFQAEVTLNQLATNDFPDWLREGAVGRLHAMAKNDEGAKKLSLKRSRKGPVFDLSASSHQVSLDHNIDPTFPGDLLSNVPLSRRPTIANIRDGVTGMNRRDTINLINQHFSQASSKNSSKHNSKPSSLKSTFPSAETSTVDIQKLIPPRMRRNVSFLNGDGLHLQEDNQTEDAALRHALVEVMFSIMGFDSKMSRQHHGSGSKTRDEPAFNSSFGNTLDSLRVPTTETVPSSQESVTEVTSVCSDSESVQMTYETAVDEASDYIDVDFYRKGQVLSQVGKACPGIFFILDGQLQVVNPKADGSEEVLYAVHPGSVAGYLETITGHKASVNIIAKTDVCVAVLSREHFEKITERCPALYIYAAKTLTTLLSRPIIQLDFALEWTNVKSGSTIYHQGTAADAIYFVLNGRVRTTVEKKDEKQKPGKHTTGEYGHGSTLGELEVFLGGEYLSTAVTVRETELARFPRTLVKSLAQSYPSITFELTKIVATEIVRLKNGEASSVPSANFRTISVVPTHEGLPVSEFAHRLSAAFTAIGRTSVVLTNASVLRYLGRYAFSRMGTLKLKSLLADLEEQYDNVLFVADTGPKTSWTRTCVGMADCVLLLADAQASPKFGPYEPLLLRASAETKLILLQHDQHVVPGSTSRWLKNRPYVKSHNHIHMEFTSKSAAVPTTSEEHGAVQKLRSFKRRVEQELRNRGTQARAHAVRAERNSYIFKNDFQRLARVLSGQAVGLVLGGGGARGIAHIGVLRALEESQIPIDMVGGTSIGSFVGGLYARDYDNVPLYGRAKRFASRLSHLWRMMLDITYPATAYTTGHEFNRGVWKAFGESRIEDFWLPYFCNTTNLTRSRMEIHKKGYAWRYIRASMSLAGLVPPIEDKGEMLLDGGYMDNVPVSEMIEAGARYIIAVDVGSVDDTSKVEYGDTLSGLWVLFNRWNPFSKHPNVPNIAEIQQRLAYVSSVQALEDAKASPNLLYLRPPIDFYATLDFGKFDEILSVGYTYAVDKLKEIGANDKLGLGAIVSKDPPKVRFRRHSI